MKDFFKELFDRNIEVKKQIKMEKPLPEFDPDDPFKVKTPTAVYIGNGYGKLTGYSQIEELGNSETPIILTNTLSVPTATQALIEYTLKNNSNVTTKYIVKW